MLHRNHRNYRYYVALFTCAVVLGTGAAQEQVRAEQTGVEYTVARGHTLDNSSVTKKNRARHGRRALGRRALGRRALG